MTITKSDIEHICGLSKLNLDDDEVPIYLQQMTDILEMIEQLQSADTNEIIPMAHPLDMHQRLREDIVTETNHRYLSKEFITCRRRILQSTQSY
jgi:aspartyl-tRNA(Asn)/glutamyl-tRNA(Gln) amidotransferase subunit C